jgi:hypothetical protein
MYIIFLGHLHEKFCGKNPIAASLPQSCIRSKEENQRVSCLPTYMNPQRHDFVAPGALHTKWESQTGANDATIYSFDAGTLCWMYRMLDSFRRGRRCTQLQISAQRVDSGKE